MILWRITIYRIDSQAQVVYENVKHYWWEENSRLVISVLRDPLHSPEHFYWTWPVGLISHLKAEKVEYASADCKEAATPAKARPKASKHSGRGHRHK